MSDATTMGAAGIVGAPIEDILRTSFDAFARAFAQYVAGFLVDARPSHSTDRAPMARLPTFMSPDEYARHARCSPRKLAYVRKHMEEGVHYSHLGRRVRFHVAEADAFLRQLSASDAPIDTSSEESIRRLARANAGARRSKTARQ